MLNWLKRLFKSRSISEALNDTKKVKIDGVLFHIRRISIIDHLTGAKTLLGPYQTYEDARLSDKANPAVEKIKEHYKDTILAGVVKPKLTRHPDKEPAKVDIQDILNNGEMAVSLYEEIIAYTYGKKKLNALS